MKNGIHTGFWDGRSSADVAGRPLRGLNRCCVDTTLLFLGSMAWALGATNNARAQAAPAENPPAAIQVLKPVSPQTGAPSAKAAADAFVRVEDWLAAGEVAGVPENAGGAAAALFSGASLWVRAQGRVIARASLMTPPGQDIPDVLERVAKGVLDQVGHSFEPARFPGIEKKDWVRATLGGTTLTLEVAGPLVPFRAETYDDVDLGISPGVFGVGAAVGGGFDAIFPLNMLTASMTPGAGLRSTIARASGDPGLPLPGVPSGAPGAIAQSHGATYYRFKTAQVTRLSRNEPPTILLRGGVVVPKSSLTHARLREFADHMALHLLERLDVSLAGEGEAVGVVELREVGTRAEHAAQRGPALVALHALSVYERAMGTGTGEDLPGRTTRVLDEAAQVLLAEARHGIADNAEGPEVIEASLLAAWLAGRGSVVRDPLARPVAEWMAKSVRRAYDTNKDEFERDLPEPVRGLVALAFVRLSNWEGSGITREEARRCVRRVFATVTTAALSAQMPWLGWAELELAGPRGEVPAAVALEDMRDDVHSRLVNAFDAGDDDADMAGGIIGAGGGLVPTWHSARPGAFLATMLGDARLTRRESRMHMLGRLLDMVRFIRQLAVDDVVLALYGDRSTGAAWGVRSALFDLRQPGDATAFSLMLVAESLGALDAMARELDESAESP
jgi:hypothetical protein